MRKLPRLIADAEAQGHPVIIDWPMDRELGEAQRRLLGTLGVLVRFVTP